MLAALMDDKGAQGNDLMGAARNLCGAFSDMLKAAEPQTNEVGNISCVTFIFLPSRLFFANQKGLWAFLPLLLGDTVVCEHMTTNLYTFYELFCNGKQWY